ncbi:MAG: DNA adenine methylase [Candidatus Helarchaeota archaeon]
MNSPIKWVGSKRLLRQKIVSLFPSHQCYVEAFFGGGSVFFHKKPSRIEVINDNNQLLITFFRVIKDDLGIFLKKFEYALVSRDLFMEYRESNWNELDDIEKAFRLYYIIKCSYGGLFRFNKEGRCNSPFASTPDKKAKSSLFTGLDLVKKAHKRLQNAIIENLDYKDLMKRFDRPTTLFFLDPPYDTDYSYGIKFNYDELVKVLRGIKGKFILTLNRDLVNKFSGFHVIPTEVNYSVTCKKGDNMREEMIILNYSPPKRIFDFME